MENSSDDIQLAIHNCREAINRAQLELMKKYGLYKLYIESDVYHLNDPYMEIIKRNKLKLILLGAPYDS